MEWGLWGGPCSADRGRLARVLRTERGCALGASANAAQQWRGCQAGCCAKVCTWLLFITWRVKLKSKTAKKSTRHVCSIGAAGSAPLEPPPIPATIILVSWPLAAAARPNSDLACDRRAGVPEKEELQTGQASKHMYNCNHASALRSRWPLLSLELRWTASCRTTPTPPKRPGAELPACCALQGVQALARGRRQKTPLNTMWLPVRVVVWGFTASGSVPGDNSAAGDQGTSQGRATHTRCAVLHAAQWLFQTLGKLGRGQCTGAFKRMYLRLASHPHLARRMAWRAAQPY